MVAVSVIVAWSLWKSNSSANWSKRLVSVEIVLFCELVAEDRIKSFCALWSTGGDSYYKFLCPGLQAIPDDGEVLL